MPVYNAERYVAQAVQSILNQTFRDFEFIIVNDGSTDGSLAILERFAKADARIKLISRPNTGYVVALNEMLEQARGEFIARMDADDEAAPNRFAVQVALLSDDPSIVACGSNVILIDPDGDILIPMARPQSHDEIDSWHLAGRSGAAIAHPAVMIRRAAIEAVGGYEVEYCPAEDVELFLRLAEHGRLTNVQQPLLRYRVHFNSVGHSRRQEQLSALSRAASVARLRRGLSSTSASVTSTKELDDRATVLIRWAWWALAGGNLGTSRKHAFRAIRSSPWRLDAWRVAMCSVRGR